MILKNTLIKLISLLLFTGILLSQFSVEETSKDLNEDGDQVCVKATKMVSPTYDFSFESLIPSFNVPNFGTLDTLVTAIKLSTDGFINGYFSKLFEHHIAINAP